MRGKETSEVREAKRNKSEEREREEVKAGRELKEMERSGEKCARGQGGEKRPRDG